MKSLGNNPEKKPRAKPEIKTVGAERKKSTRLQLSPQTHESVEKPVEKPIEKPVENNSLKSLSLREVLRDYLALKHPNYEERFAFQRQLWLLKTSDRGTQGESFDMRLDGDFIYFDHWRTRSEFRAETYVTTSDSVFCRETEFKTGDILLCNRARSSDGMFTTLVDGLQSFAHVAIFVTLKAGDETFPSVIEIHHEGVRAVPLKVFLNENFSTYLEVYRSESLSTVAKLKMSEVAFEMMREIHGFDIDMDESQKRHLSCALLAADLYERSGARRFQGQSRYHEETKENLETLGNLSSLGRDLLMPDDFTRDDDFKIIGLVDNGKFPALVARGLMREMMQNIWQTKTLEPKKFPNAFWVTRWHVRGLQKKLWPLDVLVARLFGFTRDTFPSGPATFISLTPFAERRIEKAADEMEALFTSVESSLEPETLSSLNEAPELAHTTLLHELLLKHESWQAFSRAPSTRLILDSAMKPFERLFARRLPKS